MSAEPPAAEVSHAMPGRTRLRIADRRGDAAFFATVASGLSALPGVQKVEVTPLTGSVLIRHWGSLEKLGATARDAGIFNLAKAPATREAATGAAFDPRLLAAAALGGLALWQMSREKLFPPALTLLWYAAHLGGLWRTPEGE